MTRLSGGTPFDIFMDGLEYWDWKSPSISVHTDTLRQEEACMGTAWTGARAAAMLLRDSLTKEDRAYMARKAAEALKETMEREPVRAERMLRNVTSVSERTGAEIREALCVLEGEDLKASSALVKNKRDRKI